MKNYLVILLIICGTDLSAQENRDSIAQLLREHPVPDSAQFVRVINWNSSLIYTHPEEAIKTYEYLEQAADKKHFRYGVALALKDKSIALKNIGKYNEALEALYKGFLLCTDSGTTLIRAGIIGNIGSVHMESREFSKAIAYFLQAAAINEAMKYNKYLAVNYNNIGVCYTSLGQHEKALQFHKKALALRIKKGRTENVAQCYINIANDYLELNEIDSAYFYCKNARQICDSVHSEFGLIFVYATLGNIYEKKGELRPAREYLRKSFDLARRFENSENIIGTAKVLADISQRLGDYEGAYHYQGLYHHAKDSVFSIDNAKKKLTLEYQNELDIRKVEQEKKDEIANTEKEKSEQIRRILIAGVAITTLFSLMILRGYRNKRKANGIIARQKEETEYQKVMLEEKQKEIVDSIQYAKKIQQSLMPTDIYIDRNLKRLKKDL